MFGKRLPEDVFHPYRRSGKPGVRFVQTTMRLDRSRRPSGSRPTPAAFDGDIIVVALGADLDPAATPGLVEAGHEFYTMPGAFAAARRAGGFDGGRVIVGVTSTPVQVPPRAERDGAADARLPHRPRPASESDISLVMPLGDTHPAVAGAHHRRCWRLSPSGTSPGIPTGWSTSSTRTARSPCSATAARCRTTCSSACRCTGRPRWSRSRAGRRRVDPGRTRSPSRPLPRTSTRSATSPAWARPRRSLRRRPGLGRRRRRSSPALRGSPERRSATTAAGTCYLEFGHDQVGRVERHLPQRRSLPPVTSRDPPG